MKRIFDALPGSVGYWDADLVCRFANAAYFDWFGKGPREMLGTHYRDLAGEAFYWANEPYLRRTLAGEKQCFERAVTKADGRVRHALVNYIPHVDEAGTITGFFANISDVTSIKAAEAQLEVAAAVFEYAADGIFVTDARGAILSVNPAFTEITGYSAAEVVGKNPRILKSDRQSPEFFAALWRELAESGRWQGEIWNRRKNGEVFIERQTITMIRNAAGEALRYVSVFNDITAAWQKHEQIRHLAFHDGLTGLPNRAVLLDRLRDEIAVAERDAQCLAIMFIDLDGFKAVNDVFGHDAGDALLKTVARKLLARVRSTDMVARIGGDEFIALIRNIERDAPLERIAQGMIAAINEPLDIEGLSATVGVSIGIAMYPVHGRDAADLMRGADAAMYAAKSHGKNTHRFALDAPARQSTA